jgi:hypothetical protein
LDNPYGKGVNRHTFVLKDIIKSIEKSSKRYREGCHHHLIIRQKRSTVTCSFQCNYINWSQLWPNTRIPRSDTTRTDSLTDCCIIEVDLESVEQVDESTRETREIILFEDTVVGQLTREEILVNTDISTIDVPFWVKPTSTRALIKDSTQSTIGSLPCIFRTHAHQRALDCTESYELRTY